MGRVSQADRFSGAFLADGEASVAEGVRFETAIPAGRPLINIATASKARID